MIFDSSCSGLALAALLIVTRKSPLSWEAATTLRAFSGSHPRDQLSPGPAPETQFDDRFSGRQDLRIARGLGDNRLSRAIRARMPEPILFRAVDG